MSLEILGRSSIGEPAASNPYLTFPVALQAGVLTNPEAMATPPSNSLGVDIANGHIPNSKGAGIINLTGDIVAFDHASIEYTGNSLYILPAGKDAVNHQGEVTQEGAILMGNREGLIHLVALAIDTERNPWLAHRLNRHGRPLGKIATFSLGIDAPRFDIVDINSASGLVIAQQRNRFF